MSTNNEIDFKTLFEEAPGLFLVLSPSLIIQAVSSAFVDAINIERDDLEGKYLFDIFSNYPNDVMTSNLSDLSVSLQQVIKSKTTQFIPKQRYNIKNTKGDFEEKYWKVTNSPILNLSNEIIYITYKIEAYTFELDVTSEIPFQDVLESKVAERTFELNELLTREKEMNAMKSNLVSMASHEFRTPLGTILSSISLLKKHIENFNQELIEKHIDRISSSVSHLNTIINDFLTIETQRKGFIDYDIQVFNLPDFMKEIISDVEIFTKIKEQKICYSHTGESNVNQSSKILKNILLNLLSNASKYSANSKFIQIETQVNDNEIIISIQDEGIGIPLEDQKKLFSEFYRASNAKNIHGTGLGLVIVKNYIALLEGTIAFNSEINKGSVFTITLPRFLSSVFS
jgi:signal transduction histidine kinase